MPDTEYLHPAFPQPEDPTVHLWRYMDAPKFTWMVEHKRLFMPSASCLDDPLEGTVPDGERVWWEREAANADSDQHRQIIERNRTFLTRFAEAFRERFHYVSCWHMNAHENHAMWHCYTTQSESVAVWTTYQTLRGLLPAFVFTGVVRYLDYATGRLPSWNMFEYIMHKDIFFSFEQEVRAVAFPPAVPELGAAEFEANLFEREDTPGFAVYAPPIDLTRLILGVFLHPEASAAFEAEIGRVCEERGLLVPERSRGTRPPNF